LPLKTMNNNEIDGLCPDNPGNADPDCRDFRLTVALRLFQLKGAKVRFLRAGANNRAYKINDDGQTYLLRLTRPKEATGINRRNEKEMQLRLSSAGHTAAVIDQRDSAQLLEFIPGRDLEPEDVIQPAILTQIAAILRFLHSGPALIGKSLASTNNISNQFILKAKDKGRWSPAFTAAHNAILKIANQIGVTGPTPCHCDCGLDNWRLGENGKVYLLDFECAANADPFRDLGKIVYKADLSSKEQNRLLQCYLGVSCKAADLNRLSGHGLMELFLNCVYDLATAKEVSGDELLEQLNLHASKTPFAGLFE